jgi:formylglycine-generating enzyme required for sulfatase activity
MCGSQRSQFFGQRIDPTHVCPQFEENPAQGYYTSALVAEVANKDRSGEEIAKLFEAAIQGGLPEDDEVQARSNLADIYLTLGAQGAPDTWWTNPLFCRAFEELEYAIKVDSERVYGAFDSGPTRAALFSFDGSYTIVSNCIQQTRGDEAAIAYLEEKLKLFEHLSGDPMVNMLLNLGVAYLRGRGDEGAARACFQRVLRAQPIRGREEQQEKVRGKARNNLALLPESSSALSQSQARHTASSFTGSEASRLPKELTLDLGTTSSLFGLVSTPVALELVLIPAGSFVMEHAVEEEQQTEVRIPPRISVTISTPFYMGKYPVTQEQYVKVMGRTASAFRGPKNPAERVSWNDASEFCRKLSALTGHPVRLPTLAEWQYACRAGTSTRFFSGESEADLARVAWYQGNSGGTTHPVGQKPPNAWGLYDVHGNVYEWCQDAIGGPDYHDTGPVTDPVGLQHEDQEASGLCGGCWGSTADECRSAAGMECAVDPRNNIVGFRVVVDSAPGGLAAAKLASRAGVPPPTEHGTAQHARASHQEQGDLARKAMISIRWSAIIAAIAGVFGIATVAGATELPVFSRLAVLWLLIYAAWSTYWGWKVVWPWWRNLNLFGKTRAAGENGVAQLITAFLFLLIPLTLASWYGEFGGGFYQFLEHWKLAKGKDFLLRGKPMRGWHCVVGAFVALGLFIVLLMIGGASSQPATRGNLQPSYPVHRIEWRQPRR